MVSRNEDQTIKLEMTIDRAELERQLGTVFQGPAGTSGGVAGVKGGGKPVGSRGKPMTVEAGAEMAKQLRHMRNLVGIYFGIGAMVKNSQVLNTTLGALGTTMGAIMDSFLAPLIPHLIPLLTKLADLIPVAIKAGEDTSHAITDVKDAIKDFNQQSKTEKVKRLGETGLNIGKDLAIWTVRGITANRSALGLQTTAEKGTAELESLGFKQGAISRFTGGSSADRAEAYSQAFGAESGAGRISPSLANRMSGWSDEQLGEFLRRNATNITVQGADTEEIMSKVRDEIEKIRRDTNSGSSGAN